MAQSQKSGIGYYAVQCGDLKVGAVVIVNALGDVFDYRTGKKIAGTLNKQRTEFIDGEDLMYERAAALANGTNTTIGAVITNAQLSQQEMCKVAAMTRSALARCINPVGTTADGDTVYAVSVGKVPSDVNVVGTLASRVLSEAILDAVKSSAMDDAEYLKLLPKMGEH